MVKKQNELKSVIVLMVALEAGGHLCKLFYLSELSLSHWRDSTSINFEGFNLYSFGRHSGVATRHYSKLWKLQWRHDLFSSFYLLGNHFLVLLIYSFHFLDSRKGNYTNWINLNINQSPFLPVFSIKSEMKNQTKSWFVNSQCTVCICNSSVCHWWQSLSCL